MNTDYNLMSCHSCLVKKHGVCEKRPHFTSDYAASKPAWSSCGADSTNKPQPKLWTANDDIPTGNLLSLHNMHPNTNQQPIYSLHEDSSLTMPSRSPSDLPITCRDLQFLGKYPKGLCRRCHYRNLAPDVRYQMCLEHWVWKRSN